MNFAVLSKIKSISGYPLEHIKELKLAALRQRVKGFYEVAYYLAPGNPYEFYTLSTWYNLEAIPDFKQEKAKPIYSQVTGKIKLEQISIFRLAWEYRRMEIRPGMSVLRLAKFPKDYPVEWLAESDATIKEEAHRSPGFIGAWMGYNQEKTQSDGNLVRLLRGDWESKEAFLNYANSPAMQSLTARSKDAGVIGELASSNLQDIVRSPLIEQEISYLGIKDSVGR